MMMGWKATLAYCSQMARRLRFHIKGFGGASELYRKGELMTLRNAWWAYTNALLVGPVGVYFANEVGDE